jgi:hypothetical protein
MRRRLPPYIMAADVWRNTEPSLREVVAPADMRPKMALVRGINTETEEERATLYLSIVALVGTLALDVCML